jgi:hypothetical protein
MHFEHVMSHQNPHEMRQNGYENTCREQGQATLPQPFDKIRTGRQSHRVWAKVCQLGEALRGGA